MRSRWRDRASIARTSLAAPAHAELRLLRGDAAGAARSRGSHRASSRSAVARSLGGGCGRGASRRSPRASAASTPRRRYPSSAHLHSRQELGYGGLPLAQLHEAQARVALAAGAADACGSALAKLASLLDNADAPALWNAYEALLAESQGAAPAGDGDRPYREDRDPPPVRGLARDLDLDLQRDPDPLPEPEPSFGARPPGARAAARGLPRALPVT